MRPLGKPNSNLRTDAGCQTLCMDCRHDGVKQETGFKPGPGQGWSSENREGEDNSRRKGEGKGTDGNVQCVSGTVTRPIWLGLEARGGITNLESEAVSGLLYQELGRRPEGNMAALKVSEWG